MSRAATRCLLICCPVIVLTLAAAAAAQDGPTRDEAVDALHRAVRFFREEVSAGGGYIYRVSADLSKREGEGVVGPTTAWIQPPGTPAVGRAYLEAYRLTGDPLLLEAALETGMALVRGQLVSGGWDNRIEFAPEDRKRYAYRVDGGGGGGGGRSNTTTFDDDKSQSALRFLMQLDAEYEFENEPIREAARYALEAFLAAQYPNGAWPQRYREPADPEEFPVKRASYPEEWSREHPGNNYSGYYTLNDNTIADLITTMLDAYDIYGDSRFLDAARRGGDFFLLAQMPDPQPGWAQQYDRDMHPAWARRFEPPALSGGESQGAMRTLLMLYRRTGEQKYLEPIPRAIEYYRRSLRPDGRLARFYELKTNRPLYLTRGDYQLTYSDADMPTHYAFIVGSRLDRIEREYEELARTDPAELRPDSGTAAGRRSSRSVRPPRLTSSLRERAGELIAALDARGAWVEEGGMRYHEDDDTTEVIDSRTFIRRLETLSEFIAAAGE